MFLGTEILPAEKRMWGEKKKEDHKSQKKMRTKHRHLRHALHPQPDRRVLGRAKTASTGRRGQCNREGSREAGRTVLKEKQIGRGMGESRTPWKTKPEKI